MSSRRPHWIGLKTLVARECGVILRFWTFTLAPPVITTFLYFTIFGALIGSRVGKVGGVEYIRYLAPGLIVLWVVPYAYAHTAAGFMGARLFKYIEEILIAPLPGWTVALGYVSGGVIRGVLVGLIAMAITTIFIKVSVHSVVATSAALCLAALVAALSGFITALFAKNFEQVTAIQTLIITPLMYVGGVFNSIWTLPDWARQLALANPLLYAVNAFRYGILGTSDVSFGCALLVLCALASTLLLAAVVLMKRGAGFRE